MPDQRSIIDYINDILDAMSKAEEFIGNMTYEEFEEDEKTVFAVVRAFEIIGEASTHILENSREEYQEIPWGRMVGMRNVLIHRYFGITGQILWNTIKNRFPGLRIQLSEMLNKEMKKNEVEVKVKEVASFGQVFNASCATPGSVRKKHLPRVDK